MAATVDHPVAGPAVDEPAPSPASPSSADDGSPGRADAAKEAGASTADAPEDPWTAFAPTPEPPPGRGRRVTRRVGRALISEYALAILGGLLLAAVMTWPTLQYPAYQIPHDVWDPTLQAWQMAWSGHILLTDPGQLWHANAFYPERFSFAFSDTLLGYSPAGMIGTGPFAAVLRYNIVFVLAHALLFTGAYALVRQLGARPIGAAVAGVAFAYAPWRLAQEGHLHIISAGGIPLALAMLARGHGWSLRYGYRPGRRHAGWAMAGWLTASWQLSLGFGIGLPFAYALAVLGLLAAAAYLGRRLFVRRWRKPFGWRLLITDVTGGAVFAAVGVLLALPYFRVAQLHPQAQRSAEDIALFSPPPHSLLIAPEHSAIWGDAHQRARETLFWVPEMTLLPGFALYALALAGLVFSIWTVRQRLLLLVGAVLTAVLSLGTEFFGGRYTYLLLFEHLPGWNGIRTPGRLIMWTTLFLGVLAAGAVTEFTQRARQVAAQRVPPWPGPALRLAMLAPLLLVTAEGWNTTPHPIVPLQPAAMRTVNGPLLVLPTDELGDQHAMLWSTTKFQPIANGGSGFVPQRLAQVREISRTFPDATSVAHLRSLGIRAVVLLRDRTAGTPWERAAETPVDALGIQRQDLGDAVVFRL